MPYLGDLIMMMDRMTIPMLRSSPQNGLSNQQHSLVYSPRQQPYQPLMIELKHINYASLICSSDGQTLTQSNNRDNYSGTATDWWSWTTPP
jgi:hypothetical protein